MKLSTEGRALSFVLDDAPVARTVNNRNGILLDLDANDRVLAVEVYDFKNASGFDELARTYDLQPFFDAVDEMVANASVWDKTKRPRKKLAKLQSNLSQHHAAHHHAAA